MTYGQPIIPGRLMRALEDLQAPPPTRGPGGKIITGEPARVPFRGCVLPVSEDDWRHAPQGTYTRESRKIYTNGYALRVGAQVYDPLDGATYTVAAELDYGGIHPLRRYVAERKGKAASK